MDLAQLMPILMKLLQGNSAGGGGQDMIAGSLKQALSMMLNPNSAAGQAGMSLINTSIAPMLRQEIFGNNAPFSAYGGPGSTWNPMTRITEQAHYKFKKTMDKRTDEIVSAYNKKLLDDMLKEHPALKDSSTLNAGMIALGTSMTGASDIGKSFFNNAASFGYLGGPQSTNKAFSRDNHTRQQLIKNAQMLTKSYLEDRQGFGNLSGKDVGTLVGFESERGNLDLKNPEQLKNRMQKTSRAISSIRDILTGPMPQVIKALESTFGGQAINTFGLDAAAGRLQQYKQMSLMTGVSVGKIGEYSAASQIVSQQIAGHSLGAGQAGSMVAAYMHGGFGNKQGVSNLAGVDLNQMSQTMVARVTGAQTSANSLRVAAAVVGMRRAGATQDEIDAFKEKALNMGPISAQGLADLTGGRVNADEIESGRHSRAARDEASKNSFSTRVALSQTKNRLQRYRKQVLNSVGINGKGDEALSLRQLEKKYKGTDALKKLGAVTDQLDMISEGMGYHNDDEAMAAMNNQEKAFRVQQISEFRGKIAQQFAQTSGGFGQLLQNIGSGKDVGGSLNKFLNVIDDKKAKAFMTKALSPHGEYSRIIKNFTKAGDTSNKLEQDARNRIITQTITELSMGQDAEGKPLDDDAREKFGETIQKKLDKLKSSSAYQLDKAAYNVGTGANKGRHFKDLKYDERQKVLDSYLLKKVQGVNKDFQGRKSGEDEETYSARLRDAAAKINTERKAAKKKGLYDDDGAVSDYVTNGLTRTPSDMVDSLLDMLRQILAKIH